MKKALRNSALFVSVIALLFSCDTTNTSITANWKSPEKDLSYHSVLVTALTNHAVERNTVETEIAATFGENGIHAVGGIENYPDNFHAKDTEKEALMNEVHKTNTDAILTVSLLKTETGTRYVKGNKQYNPMQGPDYYQSFYNYYSHWYPYVYNSDYYKDNNTYYLETNLYDASTEKLIWSGQSVTYSPVMLADFAKEYAKLIVDRMKKEGVLTPLSVTAEKR